MTIGLAASSAGAATLTIEAVQDGDDVVFIGSGAIDLTGLGAPAPIGILRSVSSGREFGVTNSSFALVDRYEVTGLFTTFTPLGASGFDLQGFSAETGDPFYLSGPGQFRRSHLRVARGYASLDPINFLWRALDTQMADLDLNFGTIAAFGNNTITLTGTPVAPVPLPASGLLLVAGLGALWRLSSNRKTATV
ncbi:MAG: hypothetical protein AAGL24_21220 [Pseudomonadota bacterium]